MSADRTAVASPLLGLTDAHAESTVLAAVQSAIHASEQLSADPSSGLNSCTGLNSFTEMTNPFSGCVPLTAPIGFTGTQIYFDQGNIVGHLRLGSNGYAQNGYNGQPISRTSTEGSISLLANKSSKAQNLADVMGSIQLTVQTIQNTLQHVGHPLSEQYRAQLRSLLLNL